MSREKWTKKTVLIADTQTIPVFECVYELVGYHVISLYVLRRANILLCRVSKHGKPIPRHKISIIGTIGIFDLVSMATCPVCFGAIRIPGCRYSLG
jgi:hypothetical protein